MEKSKGVVMGLGITFMLVLFAGIIHAEDVALEKGSYVFRIEQDEGNIIELDAEVLEVVDGLLIDMRLPELSFMNVRELLRQVFPLKTLTKSQAIELVTKHPVNRTKSTKSRLKGTKIQI